MTHFLKQTEKFINRIKEKTEMKQIMRRCMVCGAIELNNKLVAKKDYNRSDIERQYRVSDGFISQQCYNDYYAKEPEEVRPTDEEREEDFKNLSYEKCPK